MPNPTRPLNLMLLVPDQWRADYLSCYGHPTINTQHIDRLARQGVRFDRAYCAAPLCGPSRISFVTSMRLSEHNHRNYGSTIDYNVPNLIRSLKQAGYRTAMFGKNHCFNYDQLSGIFDELHERCLGNYDQHPQYTRAHSAFELEKDHPYNMTKLLADEAIDFVDRSPADKPFVCWVNWQDPHPAFTCPKPYCDLFDPAEVVLPANWRDRDDLTKPIRLNNWRHNSRATEADEQAVREAIAMYMGQCRYVDDQVGRIVEHLEQAGRLEDTLVVFFSDHGELLGDFGVFHKIPTFPECLARIPLIVRYPANAPRKPSEPFTFDGMVEEVDFAPTLLEILGVPAPQSMVGRSWHDAMCRGDGAGRDSVLVEAGLQIATRSEPVEGANHVAPFEPNSFGPGAMVCDGRYKLTMYFDDRHELYDLASDPHEQENLWGLEHLAPQQMKLMELLVQRLLGVGVRREGPWQCEGPDVRHAPPEARQSAWSATQLIKKPPFYKANPTVEDWPEIDPAARK